MPNSGRLRGTTSNDSAIQAQQELRLEKIIETAGALIIGLDGKGCITLFNKKCEEITGYSCQEVIGKTIFSLLIPKAQLASVKQIFTSLESSDSGSQFVSEWITKSGEHRLIEWNASNITDRKGIVQEVITIGIDITEQQKAKEALLESEKQYRLLFENLSDGVFVTDTKGIVMMCNEKATEIFGYTIDEAIGLNIEKCFHPDDKERGMKAFRNGLKTLKVIPSGMEWKGLHKDGSTLYFHVTSTILLKNDRPQGYQFLIRDVTKRKNAEVALQRSEERYRLLFEKASDVICVLDLQGRFFNVSPSVEGEFGYKPNELIGKKLQDVSVFSPETLKTVLSDFKRIMKGEKIPRPVYELIAKDGTTRISELRAGLMQKEKEIIGVIIMIRDITERVQMEKALRESEEKYRSLVEHSLQGLVIAKGPSPNLVFANSAMERVIGFTPEELTLLQPEGVVSLIHPDDRALFFGRFRDRLIGKSTPERYEFRGIHKNKTVRWIEISSKRIEYENEPAVQATFVDITDRKRAEIQLRNFNQDLELYASILRHDLGNDLQLIFSNSEVAELLLSSDSKLREFNEATKAAAERMASLLKIFARPDMEVEKEIVVLLERLSSQAEKTHKHVKITVKSDPENRHLQVAGGRLLPMVFNNLFRNAAQHAGPKPKVQVTITPKEDYIEIDVVDDGPGIPQKIRPKLFQRGVSTIGGGLGLYLSKRILGAYGGSIKLLRRRRGQGASFRITLPLFKA
jgi:PAS domain S-box-containing protein